MRRKNFGRNKICSAIGITLILMLGILDFLPAGKADVEGTPSYCNGDNVVAMIQQINESLVFYHHDKPMEFGPRYTGSENCTLAGQYIYDEFEEMGLDVEFHNWKYGGFHSRNIVGVLQGVDPSSNAIFIMSAHYDCTPGSLGANDDGSGVAAVLSAAKVMSRYSFNHTIYFILFSGEEVGTYGSFCYARDAYKRGDNIVAVINADMIGYAASPEGKRIIRFNCPERSAWITEFAEDVSKKYRWLINLSVDVHPNCRGADHQAFVDYGYDGVWVSHYDGYPWSNTPEDTPDRLNRAYQVNATKILLAVVVEIAVKPIDVQVILKTPLEASLYLFSHPTFPLDLGRQGLKGFRGITVIFGRAVISVDVLSNEEVRRVIFCIDDNYVYLDSEYPYEWEIHGKYYPLFGRHTLKVYAYTLSGKVSMDEMDTILFICSYRYCKR